MTTWTKTDLGNVEVDNDVITKETPTDDDVETVNNNSNILEESVITYDEEIQGSTLPEVLKALEVENYISFMRDNCRAT